MLAFVIGLAMIFALTSNDIISYITKMISMLMSGLFVCSILAASGCALTGRARSPRC
jgi:SSS family solute:Na+ symporter